MKKLLIGAMITASLIATMAQAQTYNATGSERQAASNEMGMYQLTLEAFRKSQYYQDPQTQQARIVHDAIDKTNFGKGRVVRTLPSGQITQIKYDDSITPVMRWVQTPLYQNRSLKDEDLIEDSQKTWNEFRQIATYQRVIYLSLADIAQSSFPVIRSKRMNRKLVIDYMVLQIDKGLQEIINKNDIQVEGLQMQSSVPSSDAGSAQPRCGGVTCKPFNSNGTAAFNNNKLVLSGFYEWTALWDDGVVLKSNYGQVDLSNRGRPWFSEAGIKGEKLSIAGSSDRGSSTSQKRGE